MFVTRTNKCVKHKTGRGKKTLIHFNNIYGNVQCTLYCLIHPLTYSTTIQSRINYSASCICSSESDTKYAERRRNAPEINDQLLESYNRAEDTNVYKSSSILPAPCTWTNCMRTCTAVIVAACCKY